MTCHEHQERISGHLDGELSEHEARRFEEHLAVCRDCRDEWERLRNLKEDMAMLKFREPSDAELERYWRNVYNRLERGTGWILFSLGAIITLSYGSIKMFEVILDNADLPWVMKLGIVSLAVGAVVLFVSVVRERLMLRKGDKYSQEVQR